MNENINLVEILKDCPKGTKLYSPLFGEVEFVKINTAMIMPIMVRVQGKDTTNKEKPSKTLFYANGKFYEDYSDSECLLFPSKNQRDWSKFKAPIPDKALVWCWNNKSLYGRQLRFYNAKNQTIYNPYDYTRDSIPYDNYELYVGEYPDWAKEAQKELED